MGEHKKLETFTTPKATSKWVTLNKPATNFKPEGEYRVQIVMPADSPECQALIEKITAAHAAAVADAKAELLADPKRKAKAKNMKVADLPFKDDTDKDGNETGNVAFSFKAAASGKRKDNSVWHFKPAVFDAKGKPLSDSVMIYGGSVVKVAYQMKPFYTDQVGAGISMKLQAVQVIELKSGSGARDASGFGFGEEDGFDSSDAPGDDGAPPHSDDDAAKASGVQSGGDF